MFYDGWNSSLWSGFFSMLHYGHTAPISSSGRQNAIFIKSPDPITYSRYYCFNLLNMSAKLKLFENYFIDFIEASINSFIPNGPFLYPLKTSENRKVFWCFQGVEKGCIRNKYIKSNKEPSYRILHYIGKYGSEKTRILAYFMQCCLVHELNK